MRKGKLYTFLLFFIIVFIQCKRDYENYEFNKIDIFNIYSRTLKSFEIDSLGNIIEFENIGLRRKVRIYSYSLDKIELDSLKEYVKSAREYIEPVSDKISGCVDGTSYKLTITIKDKIYELGNTICDDINIVDEMVFFILNTTASKDKKLLFKNYVEYENMIKEADSILNLGGNGM